MIQSLQLDRSAALIHRRRLSSIVRQNHDSKPFSTLRRSFLASGKWSRPMASEAHPQLPETGFNSGRSTCYSRLACNHWISAISDVSIVDSADPLLPVVGLRLEVLHDPGNLHSGFTPCSIQHLSGSRVHFPRVTLQRCATEIAEQGSRGDPYQRFCCVLAASFGSCLAVRSLPGSVTGIASPSTFADENKILPESFAAR
jgi:hypothetical protein